MKKQILRLWALIICVSMALSLLAGCDMIPEDIFGNQDQTDSTNPENCTHTFGEWILDVDGQCEDRVYYRSCSLCNKVETKRGEHDIKVTRNQPICGHINVVTYECMTCGDINIEEGDVKPLEEGGKIKHDGANHWIECDACNGKSEEYAHTMGTDGYCSVCDYFNSDYIVSNLPENLAHLAGTYNITIWVSEVDGVAGQFAKQIDIFEKMYPGIVINAAISGVTEADAGFRVLADVDGAPDVYCFAQDQLVRLVEATALAAPCGDIAADIRANNDAGAVAAATVAGTIYAYPMTSDNGYFMYYDKSIITEEDAESMERLIEICNQKGRTFNFDLTNGWYIASFFMATGCESIWTTNNSGQFVGVYDTYNSDAGLVAMKGMQKLMQSPCYGDYYNYQNAGVIISGVWDESYIKEIFGANYAATDLPSFTVDGRSYHLGSFSGNKLMGVKPQNDPNRAEVLSLLAQFLTGEVCQQQRFDEFNWGPSNLEVQMNAELQNNVALAALAKQSEYAKPQGYIYGEWWGTAGYLGYQAQNALSDDALKQALAQYEKTIKSYVNQQ